ncbi:hypothetical protein [Octadecabacter ascidiaceicola]|uniref:Uncharacterized protein n=1 Tax=Octadecabacter ascidiaceicola TaxID=1655543 RepID=A0A238JNP1_9RHOB|nr:hypothetical protein [Octadecabacter ascidiaceicola]SMX31396.1 hypothetical protein OCA8868_00340 [Octadecabacter ascidiaceicola]
MNRQPTLTDGSLTLRPLEEDNHAGLQLAQTTFSIGHPDADGISAEKVDGQDGGLTPKI